MPEKVLSARQAATITKPGLYADGGGLYLQVSSYGTRSWIFRFQLSGRRRDMGLGRLGDVSLAQAREKAGAARALVLRGEDPIEVAKAETGAEGAAAPAKTFRQAAAELIDAKSPGWSNAKHAAQWTATLETYAYPVIGDMDVNEISAPDVLRILSEIWVSKSETASRLRGRIEAVLDYSRVMGWRSGENPARWRGNLAHLLPSRFAVAPPVHRPSLSYAALPAFWPRLQAADGIGARALEMLILTAARSAEVIGARWPEIDSEAKIWTIPAGRMKARNEHRVPLTAPAVALLRRMWTIRLADDGFIFPGQRPKKGISSMTMAGVLRRMKVDVVPHGFRATFRTWAAEVTATREDIAEAALAHTQGKLTAAYQRGDLFEARRKLMDDWAAFVTTPPSGTGPSSS